MDLSQVSRLPPPQSDAVRFVTSKKRHAPSVTTYVLNTVLSALLVIRVFLATELAQWQDGRYQSSTSEVDSRLTGDRLSNLSNGKCLLLFTIQLMLFEDRSLFASCPMLCTLQGPLAAVEYRQEVG